LQGIEQNLGTFTADIAQESVSVRGILPAKAAIAPTGD